MIFVDESLSVWSNVNQRGNEMPIIISGTEVPELCQIKEKETGLVIAAAITVTQLVEFIEEFGKTTRGRIKAIDINIMSIF